MPGTIYIIIGAVVETKFGSRRDILNGKEGHVEDLLLRVILGDGEHLAIGVARMIHETRDRAVFPSVNYVTVVIFLEKEVKLKEVACCIS